MPWQPLWSFVHTSPEAASQLEHLSLGFFAGYGVVIRESGVVVLVALLIVVSGWNRLRVIAGALPPVLGLAIYNWKTFGAPWGSGYGYWLGPFHEYSLSYVFKHPWPGAEGYYARSLQFFHLARITHTGVIGLLPNLWFYPLMILGFSAIFGPPWLSLVGLVGQRVGGANARLCSLSSSSF